MDLFQALYALPRNSIYALVNEQDKQIYLTYSYDPVQSLSRLVTELRGRIGLPIDPALFNYKLLESTKPRQQLRLRYNYWHDYYKSQGYTLLNKRKPTNYKIITTIEKDFRNPSDFLFYVKLKNRTQLITVGVFDDLDKTNEFIKNYGNVYDVKYCQNNLTKQFLNGQ